MCKETSLAVKMTEPPLNNIIMKNIDAAGGTDAVEAIHNLRTKLHFVENRLSIKVVFVADDLERMRISSTQATDESTLKATMASVPAHFSKEKQKENHKAKTPLRSQVFLVNWLPSLRAGGFFGDVMTVEVRTRLWHGNYDAVVDLRKDACQLAYSQ